MGTAFSERIKELRNDNKLSQADFAKIILTNQSTLSAYENGDRLPPYETLVCIAQQFHVSIDWLCGLSQNRGPNNMLFTYSDLIRTIMALRDAPNVDISFYLRNHPARHQLDADFNTLICEINDKHMDEFFQEWEDIRSVCQKSPSGDKLMAIWLKDIFERYDFPLEDTHRSHFDEGLPFN